jgi:hypothetical protein
MICKGLALLLLAQVTCAATEIQPPRLQIGDRWEMHRVDGYNPQKELARWSYTVKKQTPRFIVYEVSSNGKTFNNVSTPGLNYPVKMGADGHLAPLMVLQWPLIPGKKYDYDYFDGSQITTASVTIEAPEKVSTPAGEFEAIRIEIHGHWRNDTGRGGDGVWKESRWYAPAVGCIVRDEYKDYSSKGDIHSWTVSELLTSTRGTARP